MPNPRQRPLAVTIIACIYILAAVAGLMYHFSEFTARLRDPGPWGIELVRLLAIVAGVFMLRGANWARWLALAWMAYHVVLSSFHSVPAAAIHALLLAVFTYFLCRRPANVYFTDQMTEQGVV